MVIKRGELLPSIPLRCLAYPSERIFHACPTLSPEHVLLRPIPLGQPPFLHRLRGVLSLVR